MPNPVDQAVNTTSQPVHIKNLYDRETLLRIRDTMENRILNLPRDFPQEILWRLKLMHNVLKFLLLICFALPLFASEDKFSEVFERHRESMRHLNVNHPRLFIMFSATPCMGKTTLAKSIEKKFKAIRISSDESRVLLSEFGINPNERDPETDLIMVERYLEYCINQVNSRFANHMIVFDKSVDRTCARYSALMQALDYDLYLIRLYVKKDEIVRRLHVREGNKAPFFLKRLDKWLLDYQNCSKLFPENFRFDEKRKLHELHINIGEYHEKIAKA